MLVLASILTTKHVYDDEISETGDSSALPVAKLAALIAPRRKFMTVIQEDCIRAVRLRGLGRNTQLDSHASFRVQAYSSRAFPIASRAFSASLLFLASCARAAFEISWLAPLYGSVPINHLVHGPTIRLHQRGSYYPARLWWCTTSRARRWTLSPRRTLIVSRTKISQRFAKRREGERKNEKHLTRNLDGITHATC